MVKGRKKLTILHVATLNQPIRPDLRYGPIETVIYNVDKGLHLLGHRSIVACSGDSSVVGEHYITVEQSIGDYFSADTAGRSEATRKHFSMASGRAKTGDIDVIHAHDAKAVEFIYEDAYSMRIPIIMTLHVDAKDSSPEGEFRRWCNPRSSSSVYCAAISEFQKMRYSGVVSAESVVYHGIEVEGYPAKEKPDKEGYLFTIGRITRDKGQDKAIEVAKRTGSRLIIAGCVQNKAADREFFASMRDSIDLSIEVGRTPVDSDYYDRVIRPLVESDKQIIYIGEINSEQKKHWYRHARATLFPIQWGEPFGLVMIESMACGTPVVALNKGAVPEIIVDGKTGFVVDSISGMVEAVGRLDDIDFRECRAHVRENFSVTNMASKYLELYYKAIDSQKISESGSVSTGDISDSHPPGTIAAS